MAFQTFFGLVPDGIIGPITWGRVVDVNATLPNIVAPRFPGNLQVGSRGDNVQIVQRNLNDLVPFYPTITRLAVDGIFGPITQGSVMAFQRIFGMSPTGIVNQTTWNLIISMRNLLTQFPATNQAAVTAMAEISAPDSNQMDWMDQAPVQMAWAEQMSSPEQAGYEEETVPVWKPMPHASHVSHHNMPHNMDKMAWLLAIMLLRQKG